MALPRDRNAESAKSFEHALQLLFADSFDSRIRRHRSDFAFRGLSDRGYENATSLQRLGGEYVRLESSLLRNFRKYAEREAYGGPRSPWHWITLAQHHGLPTRLLDWTWSPLVALHFATTDLQNMGRDGRVWCLNVRAIHGHLPPAVDEALEKDYAFVPTVEMLDSHAPTLDGLDYMAQQHEPFVLFFEPPSIDQRIVNQYALFSVLPGAERRLEDWLADHPDAWRAVDIPAAIKWEIRDKLDSMNINERVLFPGLDGLASWLKRHYSPGPPIEAESEPAPGTTD
jgi:hypothetical protein